MKNKIIELKSLGFGDDLIYQLMAGDAGLFHIAFFGHKFKDRVKQKRAKVKLNRIWKTILSTKISET